MEGSEVTTSARQASVSDGRLPQYWWQSRKPTSNKTSHTASKRKRARRAPQGATTIKARTPARPICSASIRWRPPNRKPIPSRTAKTQPAQKRDPETNPSQTHAPLHARYGPLGPIGGQLPRQAEVGHLDVHLRRHLRVPLCTRASVEVSLVEMAESSLSINTGQVMGES